jgi:FtsH-binding integral membrane protein
MATTSYPVAPPNYTDNEATNAPLLQPGEGEPPRQENDHVSDDFKYSTSVAECVLSIRHAFIRKVYTILSFQLLATGLVGALIALNPAVKTWALTHIWAFYVSLFAAIGLMIGAYIKQRSYPTNLLFLGAFTLCESYSVGVVSSLYDTNIVLQAVAITLVVFVGLSFFALQTKYDLTSWQGYLGAALWGLIGFGLIAMFFPYNSKVELGYSIIGAIVFSGYILVDTQLILTRYHPEDEVAAAISLYLDIINLFLNILRILNSVQDN